MRTLESESPAPAAPCPLERLTRAKRAYSTHQVGDLGPSRLLTGPLAPEPGDLVLAVVERIGQHSALELGSGRKSSLFPGDEIVVCYGNRYAPDQFEAEIPDELTPCHLVAAGGLAARVLSRHAKMAEPTQIRPVGLLGDSGGGRINLRGSTLDPPPVPLRRPLTFAVVGSAMNAGKTTTAANLIRGLAERGLGVGAAKVTGTAAGGDIWLMRDAGADPVLDFTHAGLASTYKAPAAEVARAFMTLTSHLAAAGVDAVVLEIADGLHQAETAMLVGSALFGAAVDAVLYAATSALDAAAGVDWLARHDLPVAGVSGLVTASPLALREAEAATGLPVLTAHELREPARIGALAGGLAAASAA